MTRMYKHINNTSVAAEILRSFYVKEKGVWKFKVMWWNIGSKHEPWSMGITQRITVTKESWDKEWKRYAQ
jgi:hypothetical protein